MLASGKFAQAGETYPSRGCLVPSSPGLAGGPRYPHRAGCKETARLLLRRIRFAGRPPAVSPRARRAAGQVVPGRPRPDHRRAVRRAGQI